MAQERLRTRQHYNRRGFRPGILGRCLDAAHGRELDRQAAIHGVVRKAARLFGWRMPWGEADEALRKRVFLAYYWEGQPDDRVGPHGFGDP
jgi:hypothetical protein